jgi:ferric-dicitrate binding protein FerR (iron transport regulator)
MDKNNQNIWELLAGRLHNELSPEEQADLNKALEEPSARALLNRSEEIHRGIKATEALREANKQKSWNTIEQVINKKNYQLFVRSFLKYAAVLVLAFVLGLYIDTLKNAPDQEIQYAEIEVMHGQTGHIFLFDGTEVFLNSGSKFRYPNQFNQSERNVFLEGEAYFKVKSNKKLPFKVNTQSLQVEVLGTSFNVSAYPGDGYQAVVLEEGKVQINELSGEKIDEIHPGQIALKRDGVEGVKIEGIEPYQYTSWKDGKVVFEGERLSDIAKKLERWYNVEIRFEKEKLKDYKFTGTILRNKPIDQSILALELLAPIRFRYEVKTEEKNVIVIVGR